MNFRHFPGVICVKNLRECGIFESPLGSPCENLHGIMQMGLNPETLILNFAKKVTNGKNDNVEIAFFKIALYIF